ncbi:MAG: metal ABC transporter substrate-binding protein [bacterium]|nr:metal ABC transporter substrate-binding protein [bacterium]
MLAVLALLAWGCGNDDAAESSSVPTIIATTGILADVVGNVACDGLAEVDALIPPGGDPHAFQASLSDRGRMENAALVVANGLFLEEGLEDTIEAVEASGTPVFRIADHISTIEYGSTDYEDDHDDHEGHDDHEDHDDHEGHDHEDHDDHEGHDHEDHDDHEGHDHEDHDDHEDHEEEGHDDHEDHDHEDHEEEGHDDHDDHEGHDHGHHHSGADPHVWFDPVRVADALPALSEALAAQAGLDAAALDECTAAYRGELTALDAEVEQILAPLAPQDRLLVTNHDALGYFADRYGFKVVGTAIPGGSTLGQTNPAALQELVEVIGETGVSAIFSETTHSSDDAEALGREAGVQVLSLYTGSLGPVGSGADTYTGFIRTNAKRIAEGLG